MKLNVWEGQRAIKLENIEFEIATHLIDGAVRLDPFTLELTIEVNDYQGYTPATREEYTILTLDAAHELKDWLNENLPDKN